MMRWPRVAILTVVWTPVALVAGLSTLAALGAQLGRISPRFDLLAQFAPLWLLGAAASLVAAFVFNGWMRSSVAAVSAIGILSAAPLIAPEFFRPLGPTAPPGAPGALKIVQFNVWHENPDPEAVLHWLDLERPDIAVIEENSPTFDAALARHPGWHVGCPRCEVMILSRQAPLAIETFRRWRHDPPLITRATFRDALGEFQVIGVHQAWPTGIVQQRQEARLAEVIAMSPRTRTIVTGDFNSTPWSFSRRRWDAAFGLIRRERAEPTFPARRYKHLRWLGLPFLPIDHVYAGPGWATVSVARGPRLSSDHYPVVMTLAPVAPR
jgi:endonuclease/exonuclease/phosphatase (EEP) superfamily protein YafD